MKELLLGEAYKYLGVKQSEERLKTNNKATRQEAIDKYTGRVKQVLRTHLTGAAKIHTINAWAIPVIRYTFACIWG